jgi:hypothetical protein
MPQAQGDFLDWAKNFNSVANTNKVPWKLPDANLTTITTKFAEWEPLFYKCQGMDYTPNDTMRKNSLFNELQKMYRDFINEFIRYNSALNDDDRRELGCHVRKTHHTPVPPPTSIPEATVKTPYPMVVEIHFRDTGSSHRGKPSGVRGAKVIFALLDKPPNSIDELTLSRFDPATPLILQFTEPDRGKSLYFALHWENAKGEAGPWSPIEMAIVP